MLADTHSHLNIMVKKTSDTILSTQELEEAEHIVNDARKENVSLIINVGTSVTESVNSIMLAQRYQHVYAAVGIHPTDCSENWRNDVQKIAEFLQQKKENKIVAVGEVGIDLYHQPANLKRQQDAFRYQIELALEHNVALIIHSRDAAEETLAVVDEYNNDISRGIFHCFSYGRDIAHEVMNRSFALGIGGTVTYPKNEILRTIVREMPLEALVFETDAPFLAPQALRGTRNHPKNIRLIAEYCAELKNISFKEITEKTTLNATQMFSIQP